MGPYVVSVSFDHSVRVWDARTLSCVKILAGHNGYVHTAVASMDDKVLFTGSGDKTIRCWSALQNHQ
jgi:WD40 repeat protein